MRLLRKQGDADKAERLGTVIINGSRGILYFMVGGGEQKPRVAVHGRLTQYGHTNASALPYPLSPQIPLLSPRLTVSRTTGAQRLATLMRLKYITRYFEGWKGGASCPY